MTEENLEKLVEKIKEIYINKKIISGESEYLNNHNEFYIYDDSKEREIPRTSILYNLQNEKVIIKTTTDGELEKMFISQLNEFGIIGKIKIETEASYWNMLSEPLMENEISREQSFYDKIKKAFIDIFTIN